MPRIDFEYFLNLIRVIRVIRGSLLPVEEKDYGSHGNERSRPDPFLSASSVCSLVVLPIPAQTRFVNAVVLGRFELRSYR
jgi:hypothetical protein